MLKGIRGFWLCVDKYRFRAAEAVLKIAYEQNQTEKSSVLALNDKIFQRLGQLVEKNKIDQKTSADFKNMLLPSQGIIIEDKYWKQQNDRLQNGVSKNNLFSFSLDPIIMSLILNQMYIKDQNGRLKLNILTLNALQFAGVFGFGKSMKVIGSKILHDMRIRELIKNGVKEQSIFSQNFKYLYFQIETPERQIMLRALEEVKRDFDQVPQQIAKIELDQQNFPKFISKVSKAYLSKQIRLRLIIDQINSAYKLEQFERVKEIGKWRQIRGSFQMPVIMISSKNNPYLEKYDPVLYFSKSSRNNIYHKKIILDNFITPNQRLNYSYGCLAFELEKYLSRDETIKILQDVSLPILTHLSIANAVRNAFQEFQLQNDTSSKKKKLSLIQILNERLNFNEDFDKFCKMTQQTHFSESEMKQCLEFMSNYLSFSCKETQKQHVDIKFGITNSHGEVVQIHKQLDIQRKRQKQGSFQTQSNYFFSSLINNDNFVFTNISIQQMEKVRMQTMYNSSIKFLEFLRNTNQNEFHKFIKQNAGYMFQAFLYNLYNIGLSQKIDTTTRIFLDNENLPMQAIRHRTNSLPSDWFSLDDEESYKTLFQKNDQYIKCAPENQAFDYILTQCQTNKKRLVLVDIIISSQIEEIIPQLCKFKRVLFEENISQKNKTNFRKEIFRMLQSDSECQLELICFVVSPVQSEGPKYIPLKELQENEKQIFKKLSQKIRVNKRIQLNEIEKERQNIMQGRQNFNSFQKELKQKGLEKRFNIFFLKGRTFSINCYSYPEEYSNQIIFLPSYLSKNYKNASRQGK